MTYRGGSLPAIRHVLTAVVLTFLGMCLANTGARAHGESAQAADTRLRAVHWYDTQASAQTAGINQSLTLTGKFYLAADWPETLPLPEQAILYTGSPETGLVRVRTEINGVAQRTPMRLSPGGSYAYEIEMRAYKPGRTHVHPVLHFGGGAMLTGPGHWLEVSGDPALFTRFDAAGAGSEFGAVTAAWSDGLAALAGWVLFALLWLAAATIVARWLQRPGLFWASTGLLVVIVAVVGWLGGMRLDRPGVASMQIVSINPLARPSDTLSVKLIDAVYSVPARSLAMQMDVTNRTSRDLQLGEFTIAYARFVNPAVDGPSKTPGPNAAVSREGLSTAGDPISAGETKRLQVAVRDVIWETERLMELKGAGRHKFSALLHFFAPNGERRLHEIVGELSLEYQ